MSILLLLVISLTKLTNGRDILGSS